MKRYGLRDDQFARIEICCRAVRARWGATVIVAIGFSSRQRAGSGRVARRRKSPRRVENVFPWKANARNTAKHRQMYLIISAPRTSRSDPRRQTITLVPISRIELALKLISPARRDRKTGVIARRLRSYSLYRWSRESLSIRSP